MHIYDERRDILLAVMDFASGLIPIYRSLVLLSHTFIVIFEV
jgi:hypothetical protein